MPDDRYAIPFALDRYRNEVSIEETTVGEDYFCPMCSERVEARRGPQLQFFAHWRNNPASFDCEAHSRHWVPLREREGSLPPSEVAAEKRRMRLAVTRDPYRPKLILSGLMPSAQPDEWSTWGSKHWTFTTNGIAVELEPLMFQPGILEAEIRLDAASSAFSVQISDGAPSLNGTWEAALHAETTYFVGDRNRAEARDTLANLWEGQVVFVPDASALRDVAGVTLELGSYRFKEIEIDGQTLELLRAKLGLGGFAPRGFEVRVLLPRGSSPFGLEQIEALPDEKIVLGVVLPQGPGPIPSIDILELPLALHPVAAATLTGTGSVKKFEFTLGDRLSRRFDIRWNRRHVSVRAVARTPGIVETSRTPTHNVRLSYLDREWVPMIPSHGTEDSHQVSRLPPTGGSPRWRLEGGLTIPVRVTFDEILDGRGILHREVFARGDSIARVIDGALFDGVTSLQVDFGILGRVRLTCPAMARADLSPSDLVARVVEVGLPKGHVRWSYVRLVFRSPSAKPHDFPGGTKKRVRHAVMAARRNLPSRK